MLSTPPNSRSSLSGHLLPNMTATAHHVLVVYAQFFCSGSLITSKIVLTAASCFVKHVPGSNIVVKLGCKNVLGFGQVIGVVEKKEHELFQYRTEIDNDIALLVLEKHVWFNNMLRKILLVEPDTVLLEGSTIMVTGWGFKQEYVKNQEKYIRQSPMKLLSQTECLKTYNFVFTSSMFCAKYERKTSLNDNGGAAVFNNLVVGISSYGANQEKNPFVALFTNVSYLYKWIKKNTEKLLTQYCADEDVASEY